MKKIVVLTSICIVMLFSFPLTGQDWFGAGGSGKYTFGVNASYNGKFRVGLHYNLIGNNGPFNRALIYNIQADIGIDEGIGSVGAELGFGQIYANGNDNIAGFGLGSRLAFRYDYCPLPCNTGDKLPKTHDISAKLDLYPGYYAQKYSVTARLEADIVNLRIKDYYMKDPEEEEEKEVSVEFVDRIAGGIHMDYTTFGNNRFGMHFTADYNHNFFIKEEKVSWNTYNERLKVYDNRDYKATYESQDDEDANCHMPYYNYEIRASLSLGF